MSSQFFHFDVQVHEQLSSALVSIVVARWTDHGDAQMALTPLMTKAEVDNWVAALKSELDVIAAKAKILAQ